MSDAMRRYRLPRWIWIGYAVLLPLCVPWYVSAESLSIIGYWALPAWCWILLAAYVALAIFTGVALLVGWRTEDSHDDQESNR